MKDTNNVSFSLFKPNKEFDEARTKLEGLNFTLYKQLKNEEKEEVIYDHSESFDIQPEKILSCFVTKNKQDAFDTLDRIIKS